MSPSMLLVLTLSHLATEPPSDADFLTAKVVGVQNTTLVGQDGESQSRALAAVLMATPPGRARTALAALEMPVLPELSSGFGFDGGSDAGDVTALHAGYVVGRIATHAAAGDVTSVRALARWVEARQGALGFLSEEVTASLAPLVEAALEGRVDSGVIAALLQAAENGSADAARPHGYLSVGLWAGMALLGSLTETGQATLLTVGNGLVAELEQDAAFDGSDRVIAEHVRNIVKELASGAPKITAVNEAGRALMNVRSDSEQ